MFCPYANGECQTTNCRFWYAKAGECSRALEAIWNAEGYLSTKDDENLGLYKVRGELGRVLSRGLLTSLSRDPCFSDEDRKLIEKLDKERQRLESLKGHKR